MSIRSSSNSRLDLTDQNTAYMTGYVIMTSKVGGRFRFGEKGFEGVVLVTVKGSLKTPLTTEETEF